MCMLQSVNLSPCYCQTLLEISTSRTIYTLHVICVRLSKAEEKAEEEAEEKAEEEIILYLICTTPGSATII